MTKRTTSPLVKIINTMPAHPLFCACWIGLPPRMVERGLPHFFDILGFAGPNATLLEAGITRPLGSSLDALRRIAGAIDGALGEQLRALIDALTSTME